MIDKRDDADKTAAACEGARCGLNPRCMLPDCIAPGQCPAQGCLARKVYVRGPARGSDDGAGQSAGWGWKP